MNEKENNIEDLLVNSKNDEDILNEIPQFIENQEENQENKTEDNEDCTVTTDIYGVKSRRYIPKVKELSKTRRVISKLLLFMLIAFSLIFLIFSIVKYKTKMNDKEKHVITYEQIEIEGPRVDLDKYGSFIQNTIKRTSDNAIVVPDISGEQKTFTCLSLSRINDENNPISIDEDVNNLYIDENNNVVGVYVDENGNQIIFNIDEDGNIILTIKDENGEDYIIAVIPNDVKKEYITKEDIENGNIDLEDSNYIYIRIPDSDGYIRISVNDSYIKALISIPKDYEFNSSTVNTPNVTKPNVNDVEVTTGNKVTSPHIDTPSVDVPDVTIPNMDDFDITAPNVEIPTVNIEIPEVTIPNIN